MGEPACPHFVHLLQLEHVRTPWTHSAPDNPKKQLIFLNLWAAPLFSLQDTAHNFAAAIYLWLQREVGSSSPACCCSFSSRTSADDAEASPAPTYCISEVTEPQLIPTALYSPL